MIPFSIKEIPPERIKWLNENNKQSHVEYVNTKFTCMLDLHNLGSLNFQRNNDLK